VQTITSIAKHNNTVGQIWTVGRSFIPMFSVKRSKPETKDHPCSSGTCY